MTAVTHADVQRYERKPAGFAGLSCELRLLETKWCRS